MMVDISDALNEARLAGVVSFLDTGSGYARIRLYNGTKPAPNGAETIKLVEIALSKPCGTVADGVLTLASTDLPLVMVTGTATWARVDNAAGEWAFDCDVSDMDGTAAIKLAQVLIYAGGETRLAYGALR